MSKAKFFSSTEGTDYIDRGGSFAGCAGYVFVHSPTHETRLSANRETRLAFVCRGGAIFRIEVQAEGRQQSLLSRFTLSRWLPGDRSMTSWSDAMGDYAQPSAEGLARSRFNAIFRTEAYSSMTFSKVTAKKCRPLKLLLFPSFGSIAAVKRGYAAET